MIMIRSPGFTSSSNTSPHFWHLNFHMPLSMLFPPSENFRQIQITDVFNRSFQVLIEKPVDLSAKREIVENQSALIALTFMFHDDKTSIR